MNKKKALLIGYILACILVVVSFTQILLTVKISSTPTTAAAQLMYGTKATTVEASMIRGYQSYFFMPALVCCIIGSISCIVRYKRGLVTAMGLVTVVDMVAMAYMTAFTKDFLIERLMIGVIIDPAALKSAGIKIITTLGPCFYLGLAAAVVLLIFTVLIFIYVPADEY